MNKGWLEDFFFNILVEEGRIYIAMQNNRSNLFSMFDLMLYSINHLCSPKHANKDSIHQSGTTGWKQKIMVLRKEKDDENKAFKIYEKYQYAKSVEVQKL